MRSSTTPTRSPALRGRGFLIADTENDRDPPRAAVGAASCASRERARAATAATAAARPARELDQPFDVSPLRDGGFLIADAGNDVDPQGLAGSGRITTVAGTAGRASGATAAGERAQLDEPHSVAALPDGGFLIADTHNHRIRWCRTGGSRPSPDRRGRLRRRRRPRHRARFDEPKAVEPTRGGGFLVADSGNDGVRMVSVVGPRPLAVTLRRAARRGAAHRRASATAGTRSPPWTEATPAGLPRHGPRTRAARAEPARRRAGGHRELAARTGRDAVVLPPTVEPGRYRARLTARTVTGSTRGRVHGARSRAAGCAVPPPPGVTPTGRAGRARPGRRRSRAHRRRRDLYRRHRRLVRLDPERRARRRLAPAVGPPFRADPAHPGPSPWLPVTAYPPPARAARRRAARRGAGRGRAVPTAQPDPRRRALLFMVGGLLLALIVVAVVLIVARPKQKLVPAVVDT